MNSVFVVECNRRDYTTFSFCQVNNVSMIGDNSFEARDERPCLGRVHNSGTVLHGVFV